MQRFNGKCSVCKKAFSVAADLTTEFIATVIKISRAKEYEIRQVFVTQEGFKLAGRCGYVMCECSCGKEILLKPVRGILNPNHVCSAKCRGATSLECECSCGGMGHGEKHGGWAVLEANRQVR